eukprot:CAMPEP_0198723030 /NCGR_PEP_ID=MMETSP1475-20131203/592_1 /TAXON_ID= ORGANISM="Unidentified sp., Strain CCMP1999" /NCGR_SAMPLE_ID=MMETSP1475 /ASSEMBLY_ACC=CAM_ASM_001111 /LENGTH=52 /DNA_ID=CAMNT_0044484011 /DNA_START=166 /DNA_END=321 /DNA_ORIENTATION=+
MTTDARENDAKSSPVETHAAGISPKQKHHSIAPTPTRMYVRSPAPKTDHQMK